MLAALSSARTQTLEHAGAGTKDALTGGYHLAFWVAAAVVAVAVVIAKTVLRPTPAPVEQHVVVAPAPDQALETV